MLSAGFVADANVLLSAVVGKAALRVFREHGIPVHITEFTWHEVNKYLPRLAGKYRLPLVFAELRFDLLPLHLHFEEFYKNSLPWARATLGERDPDDAHPLALSRTLDLPLWSNDRDLQIPGVRCYTTAALLKVLTG
jgi:predicted nucleic acid-binding protein